VVGRLQWVIAGALAAAAVAGCDDQAPSRSASAPRPAVPVAARPTVPIVVSHDDGSLPRTCGVRATATRALAFEAAFNRGDQRALDSLVADAGHFQWYSVSDAGTRRERGYGAEGKTSAREVSPPDGRPRLLRDFAERHRRGERMQFLQIQVIRIPPRGWFPSISQEVAGIEFTIMRDGPDFTALGGSNRLGSGKAGFGCSDGRLLALSMGLQAAHAPHPLEQWLCRKGTRKPGRVRPGPRRKVVACTK
jgi:hypothetical protein